MVERHDNTEDAIVISGQFVTGPESIRHRPLRMYLVPRDARKLIQELQAELVKVTP